MYGDNVKHRIFQAMSEPAGIRNPFNMVVIVAALGYFVDIYDLILFGIVKDPSLCELGIANSEIFRVGSHLLTMQMLGMLVGGIVWGILGDKKGRLSTLFLTILILNFLKPFQGLWVAGFIVGMTCAVISAFAILMMTETYNRNLDCTEV